VREVECEVGRGEWGGGDRRGLISWEDRTLKVQIYLMIYF